MSSAAILLGGLSVCAAENTAPRSATAKQDGATQEILSGIIGYDAYKKQYENAARPTKPIEIQATDYTKAADMKPTVGKHVAGDTKDTLYTADEGYVEWTVTVPETGLYGIKVTYAPVEGKGTSMERSLYIDGEIPFTGARSLQFERVWQNGEKAPTDSRGNEYRPKQEEKPGWYTRFASGISDYQDDSYLFYFTAGQHTVGLKSVKEPMAIDTITLCQEETIPDYQEYLQNWKAQGAQDAPSETPLLSIQGEDAARKSDVTLYPLSDHSSPANEPYDISKILLNSIGGNNWRFSKQWIEWDFNVEKAGFYQLAFRVNQNYKSGSFSSRTLYIDEKIPFEEAKNLKFTYANEWQMVVLGNKTQAMPVYFTAGKHTLRMEVTLGEMGEILRQVESSIAALNKMYRKILMITGSFPDSLRDYNLFKAIPELKDVLSEQTRVLKEMSLKLTKATGEKGQESANMEKVAIQLDSFVKEPDTIPSRLQSFNSNISDLSSWVLSTTEQALLIDYIVVAPPGAKLPKADAPWYQKVWNEVKGLFLSFFTDYDTIGNTADTGKAQKSVSLWLGTGRDQATVLKSLFDERFTPKSNINVNLQLVDMSVLMRAVSAGSGPDVALFQSQDTPVQYAFRNAVYDLNQFDDLDDVLGRFSSSAVEPFRIGEQVYALPEQQYFDMLFYRTDILNELGLSVPKTWDDLYQTIPELQKNHMDIGLPTPFVGAAGAAGVNSVFLQLLYQNDGELYNEDRSRCMLDSKVGVQAFAKWTELYNKYKMPQKMDMLTRFRIGEAPLVVTSYTFYNTLLIAAPEISGLWGMTLVPGTRKTDGSIDHSTSGTVTGAVIFGNARDIDASWELLKWWTGAEGQLEYGREMEAMQGASGRWATANMEAMERLPWTAADVRQIKQQWQYVKAVPEVAGGYYTARNLDNAIRTVINGGQEAKETLLDNVKLINDEIALRRKEFGLDK